MNNREGRNYKYKNNNKKFYYYCPNNKPFFNRKKYKKDNINILLKDCKIEQNDTKEQEENMLPKLPIVKMAAGIIIVVAVICGISYSYFNYYQEYSRQADIVMGEVYVKLKENTTNMTLNKLYPRTLAEARSKTDNYVDFTIQSKNTSASKQLYYTIDINDGNAVNNKVRISRDYIKVDLQEKISGQYTYLQEGVSLSNFSFEGIVPINTTVETEREFRLRIWVSEDVLISDTESGATFTQSEFANLFATYHVEVNARDRAITIPSCEGCKFLYYQIDDTDYTSYMATSLFTYGNSANETPSVITTGLYNNYLDVVAASGRDYFLGVKLNADNQATNVYACGIKNSKPFCIEGEDDTKYESNLALLQGEDLYNNGCSVYSNSLTGYGYDMALCNAYSGMMTVRINSNGNASVGTSDEERCSVNDSGVFGCQGAPIVNGNS